MKLKVIFLPSIWMKRKIDLFYNYEQKNKINIFNHKKLKFNLEPRT